jgi:hypothetical protein
MSSQNNKKQAKFNHNGKTRRHDYKEENPQGLPICKRFLNGECNAPDGCCKYHHPSRKTKKNSEESKTAHKPKKNSEESKTARKPKKNSEESKPVRKHKTVREEYIVYSSDSESESEADLYQRMESLRIQRTYVSEEAIKAAEAIRAANRVGYIAVPQQTALTAVHQQTAFTAVHQQTAFTAVHQQTALTAVHQQTALTAVHQQTTGFNLTRAQYNWFVERFSINTGLAHPDLGVLKDYMLRNMASLQEMYNHITSIVYGFTSCSSALPWLKNLETRRMIDLSSLSNTALSADTRLAELVHYGIYLVFKAVYTGATPESNVGLAIVIFASCYQQMHKHNFQMVSFEHISQMVYCGIY